MTALMNDVVWRSGVTPQRQPLGIQKGRSLTRNLDLRTGSRCALNRPER